MHAAERRRQGAEPMHGCLHVGLAGWLGGCCKCTVVRWAAPCQVATCDGDGRTGPPTQALRLQATRRHVADVAVLHRRNFT